MSEFVFTSGQQSSPSQNTTSEQYSASGLFKIQTWFVFEMPPDLNCLELNPFLTLMFSLLVYKL